MDAPYTHRYTGYLKELKRTSWAYADTVRVPARNYKERKEYWPTSLPLEVVSAADAAFKASAKPPLDEKTNRRA